MLAIAAIAAAAIAVLTALLLPPLLRRRARVRTLATPLAPALRAHVERNVRAAHDLPAELRPRFEGLVTTFLAEKKFVGCNGLVVTDEIRTTIASQACLLLLGRPGRVYDELRSILVYPSAFWVEDEVEDDAGVVTPRRRELSGESWDAHRIVLSWADIEESRAAPPDGYNVVLHEFAHYLEAEGLGLAPSAPGARRGISPWLADLRAQHRRFVASVEHGEETFLDPYAAEDESEFFAVATEDFIERPRLFREVSPALYGLMREYYGVDPAAWPTVAAA
jgi:Mlc titration factor MtfA (ptsG expression regulator)